MADPGVADDSKDSAAPAPDAEETAPEIVSEKIVPEVGTEVQASNPEGRNNCV